ncbi:type II toxin-antitoxin system RelE/ParE family toxin [bacterium]|nr:type II toxin-antitoxin system RelE/ParE family toxin [bacterium]
MRAHDEDDDSGGDWLVADHLMVPTGTTGSSDLRIPPANRLEKLSGNRFGQYSIRINDRWRICFRWKEGDAYDVEVIDYH